MRNGKTVLNLRVGQVLTLRSGAVQSAPDALTETDPSVSVPTVSIVVVEKTPVWAWSLLLFAIVLIVAYYFLRKSLKEVTDARNKALSDLSSTSLQSSNSAAAHRSAEQILNRELALARRVPEPAESMSPAAVRGMALFPVLRDDDGPSFINGGVTNSDSLALALQRAAQFNEAVARPEHMPRHHSVHRFRKGSEQRMRLVSGRYRTPFGDGTSREVTVRAEDQFHPIVWRADAVNEDGTETPTYVLEICANGMGTVIGENSDFVLEPVVEADGHQALQLPVAVLAPDPEPVVEVVAEVSAPASQQITITTPDGTVILVPAGSMISIGADAPTPTPIG